MTNMKKRVFLILLLLLVVFIPILSFPSFAHSGGTDSKGGHYDRDTGDYHYHHGHPAHDHPGGVCPYEDASPSDSNNSGIVILLLLAAGGVGVFVIYKLKNR